MLINPVIKSATAVDVASRTPVRILCYSPLPPKSPGALAPSAVPQMSATQSNFSTPSDAPSPQERTR